MRSSVSLTGSCKLVSMTKSRYFKNFMNSTLLDSLAKQLRELRALPIATPTKAKCPTDIESLLGLNQVHIQATLGKPDFVDSSTARWTYFFASPLPRGQRGGGHPELSFTFGSTLQVVDVTCHYSR
jgi:hypothetical protein